MIQDDQSQYTINKTLQRLQQDSDKRSVNITGLPAGEYSVRVYDNNIISPATDTAAAAYEHSQLLHIIGPISPSRRMSFTVFSAGKPLQLCLQMLYSFLLHKGSFTSSFFSALVLNSSVTPSVVLISTGIYS